MERYQSIELSIRNDDDNTRYTNNGSDPATGMTKNDVVASGVTSTSIVLCRRAGGQFDSTEFDNIAISRGNVTIWYE